MGELPGPPEGHVDVLVSPGANELDDGFDDLPEHKVDLYLLLTRDLHGHVKGPPQRAEETTLELKLPENVHPPSPRVSVEVVGSAVASKDGPAFAREKIVGYGDRSGIQLYLAMR